MHPSDITHAWLHAAEMAACLVELARWEWDDTSVRRAEVATRLADLVYADATQSELEPLLVELTELFPANTKPELWLASLGTDPAAGLELRAAGAFHRLRYLVYEDIPPRSG